MSSTKVGYPYSQKTCIFISDTDKKKNNELADAHWNLLYMEEISCNRSMTNDHLDGTKFSVHQISAYDCMRHIAFVQCAKHSATVGDWWRVCIVISAMPTLTATKKKTNKKFINRAKATVVGREWKKYCINYYIYMHAPSIKSTDSWLIAINSILMKTISKRTKSSIIWSLGSASDTIHAILWIRLRYSIMKNWMSNECKGKNLSLCIDRECCFFFSILLHTTNLSSILSSIFLSYL